MDNSIRFSSIDSTVGAASSENLMVTLGPALIKIFLGFRLTTEDKADPAVIRQKFENYFIPAINRANLSSETIDYNRRFETQLYRFDRAAGDAPCVSQHKFFVGI
jgi:hypothetical protein